MKGRLWLIVGVAVGIAIAAGRIPYLAGAGRSFADTAERLVGSGANRLVQDAASAGAPKRVVQGLGGLVAVLLPGVTALLLILAARGTLRLRALIGILVVVVGAASFAYQSQGHATGVLLLAFAVAAAAIALTGPLVAAPLAALAALIGAEYLPGLVSSHRPAVQTAVNNLHLAIYNRPGSPAALQVVALVVAALPCVVAARLVFLR